MQTLLRWQSGFNSLIYVKLIVNKIILYLTGLKFCEKHSLRICQSLCGGQTHRCDHYEWGVSHLGYEIQVKQIGILDMRGLFLDMGCRNSKLWDMGYKQKWWGIHATIFGNMASKIWDMGYGYPRYTPSPKLLLPKY